MGMSSQMVPGFSASLGLFVLGACVYVVSVTTLRTESMTRRQTEGMSSLQKWVRVTGFSGENTHRVGQRLGDFSLCRMFISGLEVVIFKDYMTYLLAKAKFLSFHSQVRH